ncbi:MAG: hypothetical protein K1060chlam2_00729 [Chlamydiae bacterium]|nr:hypothetical protein [Chlamydiota bacterium]
MVKIKTLLLLAALSSLLLTGCGYRVDESEVALHFPTLSVSYFSGDDDGTLTDAVIKGLSTYGEFNYVGSGGALLLEGSVISDSSRHIGYRYDRHPVSGVRINRLVPNEGRREITVRISLINGATQKVLYGPFDVSASSDYDFVDSDSLQDTSFINSAGTRESLLFFSLGQLDSVRGAHAASRSPIHEKLAVKIVEGISNLAYNSEVEP